MALHLCPTCQQKDFFWGMSEDENGQDATLWGCAACRYSAYEYDERLARPCLRCHNGEELLLVDQQRRYWWCSYCNHTTTIELLHPQ